MTVKGGSTPACAACKYQRRRCTPTCPLAPYFPATQPQKFQNVHRLFGVANVCRTLQSLKTKELKEDAMKSIIFEAELRERYPVHGCIGLITQLHNQIQYAVDELRYVSMQLDRYRGQMDLGNFEFGSSSKQSGLELQLKRYRGQMNSGNLDFRLSSKQSGRDESEIIRYGVSPFL
ncbi:hypothetical protein ACJIZ3_000674 [Penstemon smallii]|uniref:LOB domain-containing protein n=1 Tax=Penstemon smallii TaxID=265156 RepID=A0ABD3RC84_9LAMI